MPETLAAALSDSVSMLDVGGLSGRIDAVLDRAISQKRIVGAVVLVNLDGRPVFSGAAGFSDREANDPMREDALFRLASVSKPIVSTAAIVLASQGRLNLDDDVGRLLPAFSPDLAGRRKATMSVRHLLTHTGGLGLPLL